MTRPRFRDPRDRWPELGDLIPEPLPGPFGDALAALAQCVPSLSEERRAKLASMMYGQPRTIGWFVSFLTEYAPDLFEAVPSEGPQMVKR